MLVFFKLTLQYNLQQKSEEATEILEDKVKMAEEQANLLAKQAAVAHNEIISLKKESAKVYFIAL